MPETLDPQPFLALLAQQLPGLSYRQVHPIQNGWSSYVLEVDGAFIFRFPRRPETAAQVSRELRLLPYLTARLPVQVPQVECTARDAAGRLLFCGYPKIVGVGLDPAMAKDAGISRQVGQFLGALHSLALPVELAGDFPPRSALEWRDEYERFFIWAEKEVQPLLPESAWEQVRRTWRVYLEADELFRFCPVLIHGDLCVEHLLCSLEDKRLRGIIDWEDARWGDPALDFAGLYGLAGWEPVELALQAYPLDPGPNFRARVEFLAWVVPFHEVEFGLLTGSREHIQAGLSAILAQACSTAANLLPARMPK